MLPVKDNRPALLDAIEKLFQDIPDTLSDDTTHPILGEPIHIHETVEKLHGRLETRCLRASTSLNAYLDWPSIAQVIQYHQGLRSFHDFPIIITQMMSFST